MNRSSGTVLFGYKMVKILISSIFLISDGSIAFFGGYKVNKRTQELIQSDPHQAPNVKGNDRRIHYSSYKMDRRQAQLATLSQKGGNSVTRT